MLCFAQQVSNVFCRKSGLPPKLLDYCEGVEEGVTYRLLVHLVNTWKEGKSIKAKTNDEKVYKKHTVQQALKFVEIFFLSN